MNAAWLDHQVFPGLSALFILLFFAPLGVLVLLAMLFTQRTMRWAKALSMIWFFACVPAGFFMLMGYAFNSNGPNPIIQIVLWASAGLALIWIPLTLKATLQSILEPEDRGEQNPRP